MHTHILFIENRATLIRFIDYRLDIKKNLLSIHIDFFQDMDMD